MKDRYNTFLKLFILISLIGFFACKKEDNPVVPPPPSDPDPKPVKDATVYIAGSARGLDRNASFVAKYWKDGVAVDLTDGSYAAHATSIFVVGNDVHVVGYKQPVSDGRERALYWKNGVQVQLSDDKDRFVPTSVFVSGSDVYIAGINYVPNGSYAVYWKNGQLTRLTSDTTFSAANRIYVHNNDVYVAGAEGNITNGSQFAKYWKNGVGVNLGTKSKGIMSEASSIVVSGQDVHVAGYTHDNINYGEPKSNRTTATYWKNGVAATLSGSTNSALANYVNLVNSDVYVGGYEFLPGTNTNYVVWKNGVVYSKSGGTGTTRAPAIAMKGTDVYAATCPMENVCGYALYWKNGVGGRVSTGTGCELVKSVFVSPL